jgi:hypothetical protein
MRRGHEGDTPQAEGTLAGVFLLEAVASFTYSREYEWWMYGPVSLVIGLLALVVAGSGGAWPHFHWPPWTLPAHRDAGAAGPELPPRFPSFFLSAHPADLSETEMDRLRGSDSRAVLDRLNLRRGRPRIHLAAPEGRPRGGAEWRTTRRRPTGFHSGASRTTSQSSRRSASWRHSMLPMPDRWSG